MSQFYDQASLVMVPSGYKAGKVYSQKPLTTDGQLTFTRTGDTATRVNADGLVEKVRTNLFTQSENFAHADWIKQASVTLTSGQDAPDGSTKAYKYNISSSTLRAIDQSKTLTIGTTYTFSLWVKAIQDTSIRVRTNSNSWIDDISINVADGWQRIESINTMSQTDTAIGFYDVSGNTGDMFYFAFSQLEVSDFGPTAYIPTTSAAVSVGPVANLPRIDYTGGGCGRLLLEPQTTALLQYSESFDNTYWGKANLSVSPNTSATLDPSGYYGADKLVENSATSTHEMAHTVFALTAASYTYSIFAKAAERSWIVLSIQGKYTFFDVANGVIGANAVGNTAKIEAYSNGWYRCSITRTATATNNFGLIRLAIADNTPSYAGDGTSGLYVWGANLTQTSYLQSYVPTLSAAVTRGADAAYKTGISSLIGQTEGTIFGEVSALDLTGGPRLISLSDNSDSNRVFIGYTANTGKIYGYVIVSNSVQFTFTSAVNGTGYHKIALKYKTNDFALWIDGNEVATDLSGTTFGVGVLNTFKFDSGLAVVPFHGNAKQILVFPTALTNAQLAELTAL